MSSIISCSTIRMFLAKTKDCPWDRNLREKNIEDVLWVLNLELLCPLRIPVEDPEALSTIVFLMAGNDPGLFCKAFSGFGRVRGCHFPGFLRMMDV